MDKILNYQSKGVILFSLGSNARSDSLETEMLIDIMRAMKNLSDYQFIWKFESASYFSIATPKNVHLRSWIPQNDILAHPNLKLFITHGGLLSVQESIWHGKPMLGLPIFGDQFRNINHCVELGIAERLSLLNFDQAKFIEVIQQVLTNETYRINTEKLSKIVRDEKESPLKRAVWWIEWVLRNPDYSTKNLAINLRLVQKYSYEIVGLIILVLIFMFYIIFRFLKCLWKKFIKYKID